MFYFYFTQRIIMSSRAKFLVNKALENQDGALLSRTRPKNKVKKYLQENYFSDSGKTYFVIN